MHIPVKQICRFVFTFLIVAGFVACGRPMPEESHLPGAPGIGVEITATNCPSLAIAVGTQVVWANRDQQEHALKSVLPGGDFLFDSGTLQPGDTFTFRFQQQGTYAYRCASDQAPVATIAVRSGSLVYIAR